MVKEASRTSKSIKNSVVALIYYVIQLVMSFFSRKIFLDYLGADILGLNTTAQNLLNFLNLAELGISTAVGFTLYKPLLDDDRETINEIITLQSQLYRRIAALIVVGALILMAFFPSIFSKITLPLWYAYASFGVLLFSALLGYFVNYKMIILSASQNDYKILYSLKTINLIKILCQMGAVYWFENGYVWWLVIEVIFTVIASYVLHLTTKREFPYLKKVDSSFKILRVKYALFVTKIKQMFFHKIGEFVLTQSSPLIIYAYTSLSLVAYYGNYMVMVTGVQLLVRAIFNSMGGGVGNLVATGNDANIRKVFKELFSLRFLIISTLTFCVYSLADNVIKFWIGPEYILPHSTLLLISLFLFISVLRLTTDAFLNAYGLFGDIWSPIVEAVLNIGLSVLLGYFYSLNGVISGVLISLVVVIVIWKPYYLITRKMKGFGRSYLWLFFSHLIAFGGISALCSWLFRNIIAVGQGSLIQFLLHAALLAVSFVIMMFVTLYCISDGMRNVTKRFINFFR